MQRNSAKATEKLSLESDSLLSRAMDSPIDRKLKSELEKLKKNPQVQGTRAVLPTPAFFLFSFFSFLIYLLETKPISNPCIGPQWIGHNCCLDPVILIQTT